MTASRNFRGGALRVLGLAVLLAAAGPPAFADDGDGGGGGGSGGGGAGGGADGGGGASETGGGVRGFDLGPNPGSNPLRDAQRVFQSLFGGSSPPPVAAARAAPPPVELVAWQVPAEVLLRLRSDGFVVLAERRTADGTLLLRLRAPPRLAATAAAARLRSLAPGATVDRNHLYRAVEAEEAPPLVSGEPAAAAAAGRTACLAAVAVALVDTAVDPAHPALTAVRLERETLRGPGRRPSRPTHGTAVALRLAQVLPGARLVALDAFHLGADGEMADAFDLAAALDRAAALGVPVANLSLAGAANAVVARLGAAAAGRGLLIVAAAGNEGPRAPPRYPAAYPWAVAVTALRRDAGHWERAPVGPHIAFAAHGVEVALPARPGAPPRLWSGTSFAAPLVSAALATLPPAMGGADRVRALARQAQDLGAPGRDPVFGWGRVVPAPSCPGGAVLAGN